jgi:hypothetical protein
VGSVGLLAVAGTVLEYDQNTTTQAKFDSLRTWNTIAWVTTIAGTGAFVLSFVIKPSPSKSSSIRVDPTGIRWEGAF